MNALYITPIFALSGIFLGWFLNQFGNWHKSRKEDNVVRKQTVFYLLEVVHQFRRINALAGGGMVRILTELDRAFPQLNLKQISENEFEEAMNQWLKPILMAQITERLKLVAIEYEQTLQTLSGVDPVIAFYLKGRADLFEQLKQFMETFDSEVLQKQLNGAGLEHAQKVMGKLSDNSLFADGLKVIEDQTLEIAAKIGRRTKAEVRQIIRTDPSAQAEEELCEIRDFVQDFGKLLLANDSR